MYGVTHPLTLRATVSCRQAAGILGGGTEGRFFNSLDNRLEIGCNNSCTGLVESLACRLGEEDFPVFRCPKI